MNSTIANFVLLTPHYLFIIKFIYLIVKKAKLNYRTELINDKKSLSTNKKRDILKIQNKINKSYKKSINTLKNCYFTYISLFFVIIFVSLTFNVSLIDLLIEVTYETLQQISSVILETMNGPQEPL